jgi:hypothetical protein
MPRKRHQPRHLPDVFVVPLVVVGSQPFLGDPVHLRDELVEVGVEHLGSIAAVEPFDIGILIRIGRLVVVDCSPLTRTPSYEALGGRLRAVVHPEARTPAVDGTEFFQDTDDAGASTERSGPTAKPSRLPSSMIVRILKRA